MAHWPRILAWVRSTILGYFESELIIGIGADQALSFDVVTAGSLLGSEGWRTIKLWRRCFRNDQDVP